MTNDSDQVGTYFKCFRRANSHFALSEPNSFALNDWICYPVPPKVVENLDMLSDLVDVVRADEKTGEETIVRLVFCQDRQELRATLADWSLKEDNEQVDSRASHSKPLTPKGAPGRNCGGQAIKE